MPPSHATQLQQLEAQLEQEQGAHASALVAADERLCSARAQAEEAVQEARAAQLTPEALEQQALSDQGWLQQHVAWLQGQVGGWAGGWVVGWVGAWVRGWVCGAGRPGCCRVALWFAELRGLARG